MARSLNGPKKEHLQGPMVIFKLSYRKAEVDLMDFWISTHWFMIPKANFNRIHKKMTDDNGTKFTWTHLDFMKLRIPLNEQPLIQRPYVGL